LLYFVLTDNSLVSILVSGEVLLSALCGHDAYCSPSLNICLSHCTKTDFTNFL